MIGKIESSQIIFFLGAGASKHADVPTTYEFVDSFLEFLENKSNTYLGDEEKKDQLMNEFKLIKSLIEKLRNWRNDSNEGNVDIELLLETLTKLQNLKNEPLLQVFPNLGNDLVKQLLSKNAGSQSDFDELVNNIIVNLKKFIKLKTIVKSQRIEYLQPFRGFIQEARDNGTPLDIISLNYDTCIEQFCNIYKMRYEDGFDINWNPETFNRNGTDIRLYKLHGSAIWYQSDKGTFLKLPIQSDIGEIKLISDESVETLMLYPMQKWDYAEPLLELLVYSKSLLESNMKVVEPQGHRKEVIDGFGYFDYKFMIIVGYSFRDEHIKRMIWDASRSNTHLYLVIVDPEAKKIYDEIRYYNRKLGIESHLRHRVICLPYKFEEIFPTLRNYYLDDLRKGLVAMDANQRNEYLGQSNFSWKGCIYHLADAEFCYIVDDIIKSKKVSFDTDTEWPKLRMFLSMSVNLSLNCEMKKASEYIYNFRKTLITYYKNEVLKYSNTNYINVEFYKYPDLIKLKFSLGNNFFDNIKELSYFCKSRLRMSTHSNEDIEQIANLLDLFDSYFELFRGDIKGYEGYIESRQELINNLTKMVGESVDSMNAELTKIDENIEKIKEINRDYSNSLKITNSDAPPKHELRDLLINHTEKIEQQILTGLFGNLIDQYL